MTQGRGGFCYELNSAFAWLLDRLGLDVDGDESWDVLQDEQPVYRVDGRGRRLTEFEPMCQFHQTSPASAPNDGSTAAPSKRPTRSTSATDRRSCHRRPGRAVSRAGIW